MLEKKLGILTLAQNSSENSANININNNVQAFAPEIHRKQA